MKKFLNKIISFFKFPNISIKISNFIILTSILNTILYSYPIFRKLTTYNFNIFLYILISIILFILIISVLNIFYSLIIWKKYNKFIVIILFLINSSILYLMNTFNIAIDYAMVINFFETNVNEASSFLNYKLYVYIFLAGIIPSIYVYKTTVNYETDFLKEKIKIFISSLTISLFIIGPCYLYKPAFLFIRHNQKIITYLLPVNYISAYIDYNVKSFKKYKFSKKKKFNITDDAVLIRKSKNNKKNLVVFVIGESARADHFSLNGYNRETNYFLNKYKNEIISFKNFSSFDSMTETTLLYTFSYLDNDFDYSKEFSNETLLHILNKVGFNLNWKTNNGRCKQIACIDGTISNSIVKSFGNQLYDELLLKAFNFLTANNKEDNSIFFLHQWGSHGPNYKEKYSNDFEKWSPVCSTKNLNTCSIESLINVYDNTLYYTSYILSELIAKLKQLEKDYNVMLIYMSDHGESLGENGVYMHSSHPAPHEQLNPAFFLWIPNAFANEYNIDLNCLNRIKNNNYSQTNIFHSILGLFEINSKYYKREFDIFSECRKKLF